MCHISKEESDFVIPETHDKKSNFVVHHLHAFYCSSFIGSIQPRKQYKYQKFFPLVLTDSQRDVSATTTKD